MTTSESSPQTSAASQILEVRPDFKVLKHHAPPTCHVTAFWSHLGEAYSASAVMTTREAREARETLAEIVFDRISEGTG